MSLESLAGTLLSKLLGEQVLRIIEIMSTDFNRRSGFIDFYLPCSFATAATIWLIATEIVENTGHKITS